MLDGRIARLTGTTSDFGVQFDSLADVNFVRRRAAILAFAWGLQPLGRLGYTAGFLFRHGAALRLAAFQYSEQYRRGTNGISSACRARRRPASGVYRVRVSVRPARLSSRASPHWRWCSSRRCSCEPRSRFRSFKTIDLKMRRPYTVLS